MPRLVGSVHKSWFFQCLLFRRSQEICQVEESCFMYKKHISDRLVGKWHWEFHLLLWVWWYFKSYSALWLWTLWTKCTSMYYWNYIPNSKSCCSCLYIRPSFFQLTHPLNFDMEKSRCLSKYYNSKNITSRTKKTEKKKKNAKRFDPSTKSSSQCFFSHLEDLGSMLKYWLLPNPRHPFDSGLTFAMVWCPWAGNAKTGVGLKNLRCL